MKANNFMNEEYKANETSSTNILNIKKEVEKSLKNLEFKINSKGSDYLKNAVINELKNSI
ncbi:MAG: hypothetical protein IJZ64_09385 [Ruminococcus sp.]|nr:hypothetical protein [Ruminococcus sp.]